MYNVLYLVKTKSLNVLNHFLSTQTHQDIDGQLRTAAEAFLENDDACVVDSGKREVRLSQIFKWYKADFGGTDEKVALTPNCHMCVYIHSRDTESTFEFSVLTLLLSTER